MKDEHVVAVHVSKLLDKEQMEQGKVYVVDRYQTTSHLCCCGCGERIVMSIDSLGWKYSEKDNRPTFSPSIGGFGLPCKSQYSIRDGEVIWHRK